MSLPLLPEILPFEVRSHIYKFLPNKTLALEIPEVFWGIAPHYFQVLSLGRKLRHGSDVLQTEFARLYPTSGNFVKRLQIFTDPTIVHILKNFLNQFPPHRNLNHLCIVQSHIAGSSSSASNLPYLEELVQLINTSPELARISFDKVNPHDSLIRAASNRLTRLDIGQVYPNAEDFHVSLPPNLQILTITPFVVPKLIYRDARKLQTLIIRACDFTYGRFTQDLQILVSSCPALTNVGIIDICQLTHFVSFFFYLFVSLFFFSA